MVIESHARMKGQLLAAGSIQLNGWFEGELICSDLIIGPDGYLLGQATARTLVVTGQIVGKAYVGDARLEAGALFEGQLFHTRLSKSADATFVGKTISTRGQFRLPADLIKLEQTSVPHGSIDFIRPSSQHDLAAVRLR